MDQVALPPGYEWRFGGGFVRNDEDQQRLVLNMVLAIGFIYLVMAALFESITSPATIMMTIIFSIVGVFWFLWITQTDMGIMPLIGMLVLIGVVVNNGIVLIDHINRLRWSGMSRNRAILEAGHERLRPILMTALTTILGLLPLAFSDTQIGGDGPTYAPMARAIVGGLTFSTVATLLALPAFYTLIEDISLALRRGVSRAAQFGRRSAPQANAAEA